MRRRISELGHSPAKNLRALSFRNSWLSLRPNCMACPFAESGLVASGQTENEMADDVALHLGGPGFDSIPASAEISVGPKPFVDGVRVAAEELAVRAENLLRDLLEALVELAPEDFLYRAFGAGDAGSGDTAESAHLVETHDLDFRAALCEFLANDWIFGGGAAVAWDGARELDEARDVTLENEMQARAVGTALVHQSAHRHVPAVIHFAEDIFDGDAHVAKEELVKFGFACHLTQGTNFNAGRFHVYQEDGEAFVFGGGRVGANDEFAPVADPAVACPDFLPVYDVLIAVETRFGLQTGEIGTRVWLGEALAPDFFSAQDFRDVAFFLSFRSVGNDGGADETQAERVGHGRRFNARHLFPKYGLLHQRGTAPAVFLGPGNRGPAALLQFLLPSAEIRERFFHGLFAPLLPVLGDMRSKPRAEFVAKGQLFGG